MFAVDQNKLAYNFKNGMDTSAPNLISQMKKKIEKRKKKNPLMIYTYIEFKLFLMRKVILEIIG